MSDSISNLTIMKMNRRITLAEGQELTNYQKSPISSEVEKKVQSPEENYSRQDVYLSQIFHHDNGSSQETHPVLEEEARGN